MATFVSAHSEPAWFKHMSVTHPACLRAGLNECRNNKSETVDRWSTLCAKYTHENSADAWERIEQTSRFFILSVKLIVRFRGSEGNCFGLLRNPLEWHRKISGSQIFRKKDKLKILRPRLCAENEQYKLDGQQNIIMDAHLTKMGLARVF